MVNVLVPGVNPLTKKVAVPPPPIVDELPVWIYSAFSVVAAIVLAPETAKPAQLIAVATVLLNVTVM